MRPVDADLPFEKFINLDTRGFLGGGEEGGGLTFRPIRPVLASSSHEGPSPFIRARLYRAVVGDTVARLAGDTILDRLPRFMAMRRILANVAGYRGLLDLDGGAGTI